MTDQTQEVKLTQFSHGAGCGCKISPQVLDKILHSDMKALPNPNLLVGYDQKDDAAVYDQGDGTAIISTTDFFMPIVDDAFDFGRIASVNAISDVYAMGGTPLLAIAILGWPINKIAPEVAQKVIEGARFICNQVGIPLAGGHSIDSPEPIFGLAVTGKINVGNLRTNGGALPGNKIFLTKPLGVGILTTAEKKAILKEEHKNVARDLMIQLNKVGEVFSRHAYIKAMTDVTGFGLLGHLIEMCESSRRSAEINFAEVPVLPDLDFYIEQGAIPGGTGRNFDSYGHKIAGLTEYQKAILCDPQTSGGLMVAVVPEYEREFQQLCRSLGMEITPFGKFVERQEWIVEVK